MEIVLYILGHHGTMRRALIVCGSARMNGVTDAMCSAAAEALNEKGFSTTLVRANDEISHCRDCGLCIDGQCVIDDDMVPIYSEFARSDILVLATPIHFSGPSSLIKTVVDRFQPYWYEKDMPHPSRVMGLMCGGSDRPEFRPTVSVFRAFSAMLGMEWLGHLEISGTDRTGSEGVAKAVEGFIATALEDGEDR